MATRTQSRQSNRVLNERRAPRAAGTASSSQRSAFSWGGDAGPLLAAGTRRRRGRDRRQLRPQVRSPRTMSRRFRRLGRSAGHRARYDPRPLRQDAGYRPEPDVEARHAADAAHAMRSTSTRMRRKWSFIRRSAKRARRPRPTSSTASTAISRPFYTSSTQMGPEASNWLEKVREFRALVAEHAKMEEEEVFPAFKRSLDEEQNAKITSLVNKDGFWMA